MTCIIFLYSQKQITVCTHESYILSQVKNRMWYEVAMKTTVLLNGICGKLVLGEMMICESNHKNPQRRSGISLFLWGRSAILPKSQFICY